MLESVAAPAWVMVAYLIAGICFILALRGLSSPDSARRGNRTGMIGMAIAVVTTLVHYRPTLETAGAQGNLLESMENAGVVGPLQPNGAREILAPAPPGSE